MDKKLIIAEKPSMGRTIAKAIKNESFQKKDGYLEGKYHIVSWCFGHLYELKDLDKYFDDYDPTAKPKWSLSKLPFYPEGWKFKYEVKQNPKTRKPDEGVKKQVLILRELMNREDVDTIYAAGDADREGEVIVRLVIDGNLKTKKNILRLWLPALTPDAINTALTVAKPDIEYTNLYEAGKTRAAMDWLMGIELTRYASIKTQTFLRIGRCICPIVCRIVERENEINNFKPTPYSAVVSKEKTKGYVIELTSKKTFEKGHEAEAQALADKYNAAGAAVTDVKTEKKTIKAPKLFSMSDLQSYVCKVDNTLSPSDVLAATQSLYEAALVTYPRTNSNYLAKDEYSKVEHTIKALGLIGLTSKSENKNIYDDSKVESHSALIPTGKKAENLSGTQKTVYDCILNRFCAVFCEEDCTVNRTTIAIQCSDETFTLKGDVEITKGWRQYESSKEDKVLPPLVKGDNVVIAFKAVGKMTVPPKRYTVASLNSWMKTPMRSEDKPDDEYTDAEWKEILEEATICTEATRADTISRCIQSKYISLRKGTYYAEESGFFLYDVLKSLEINLDVKTTVELSRDLHCVKDGTMTKAQVLDKTKDTMDKIFSSNGNIKSTHENTVGEKTVIGKCPKCGSAVIETSKAYVCENKCGVIIWKENKFMKSIGSQMTATVAKSLLKDGKARLTNCVGKSGKTFSCNLVCNFQGEHPEFSLDFTKEVVGHCPLCASDVVETPKTYECSNDKCKAVLFKKTKYFGQEMNVTLTKAKKLFGKEPASFTLKTKEGESYTASMKLKCVEYKGKKYFNLEKAK